MLTTPMVDLVRHYQQIQTEIEEKMLSVLRKGHYVLGENVRAFEQEAAAYLGVPFAVAVNSGTDALHLALRALGVGPGDEVITPSFTFIATVEAILYCGATPVFVDIDENFFDINTDQLASLITEKTKAILPVHLFGQAANMGPIKALAEKNGCFVVEDCAQSMGASWQGIKTGAIGDAGCFSFYPTKNLSCCGDGGLITCQDEAIYRELLALRNHGSHRRYYHHRLGFNSRLDELQAVVLRVKLKYIDQFNRSRAEIAGAYTQLLQSFVNTPKERVLGQHVYHQYTILHDNRDQLQQHLAAQQISSSIYYPVPIHRQEFLAEQYQDCSLPMTERVSQSCLSLPIFPEMNFKEVETIAECIKSSS
jgi:dTDP-4-amino-4,6-dideoxygalactose transaminase